ncbi:MAG: rhomboid family intramembrane serine protease [Syntrophomonadaceae bacterium]
MFPLRDSTPNNNFPYLTVGLIVVNLLIFFFELSLDARGLNQLLLEFGLIPALISEQSYSLAAYSPLLTSMFLHGSWMHVIGNMWSLWLFGDNLEDNMGPWRFLTFYLICGLVAGFTHYLINPQSTVPVVGASGAIAGVMGAYFLMFRDARVLTYVPPIFIFPLPAWIFLGFWALSQVWYVVSGSGQSVAFWAHIGGFIVGMIIYRWFLRQGPETEPEIPA